MNITLHNVTSVTVHTAHRYDIANRPVYDRKLTIEADGERIELTLFSDSLAKTLPHSLVDMEAEMAMVLDRAEVEKIDVEAA